MATRTAVAIVAIVLCGPSMAQSEGGLKLGEDAEAPTLDLGAKPKPADAQTVRPTATPAPTAGAGGADVTRTAYGDWEVACAAQAGGCAMAQIGNDSTGTPVLEMVIRRLEEPLEVNEKTAVAVLDVITPLGVVLTEGLTMTIDKGRDEAAAFQICTEQGCLVREPVAEELIARLKRGRVAKITVFAANQGEVVSNISLKGFTKAFNATK